MKLDRNTNTDGTGKYALVLMRSIEGLAPKPTKDVDDALKVLKKHGVLDYGGKGPGQFFVMRYRDKFTEAGLRAYAKAARTEAQAFHARAKQTSGDASTEFTKTARSIEEWAREVDAEADACAALKDSAKKLPD